MTNATVSDQMQMDGMAPAPQSPNTIASQEAADHQEGPAEPATSLGELVPIKPSMPELAPVPAVGDPPQLDLSAIGWNDERYFYIRMPMEDRVFAMEAAQRVRRRIVMNAIEIGGEFKAVRGLFRRARDWKDYVKVEFGWSDRYAYMCVCAFEQFGPICEIISRGLKRTTIFMLAAPSTPEAIRASVIKKLKAGHKVSDKKIKALILRARAEAKAGKEAQKSHELQHRVEAAQSPSAGTVGSFIDNEETVPQVDPKQDEPCTTKAATSAIEPIMLSTGAVEPSMAREPPPQMAAAPTPEPFKVATGGRILPAAVPSLDQKAALGSAVKMMERFGPDLPKFRQLLLTAGPSLLYSHLRAVS
jgi:hypothetical protein